MAYMRKSNRILFFELCLLIDKNNKGYNFEGYIDNLSAHAWLHYDRWARLNDRESFYRLVRLAQHIKRKHKNDWNLFMFIKRQKDIPDRQIRRFSLKPPDEHQNYIAFVQGKGFVIYDIIYENPEWTNRYGQIIR